MNLMYWDPTELQRNLTSMWRDLSQSSRFKYDRSAHTYETICCFIIIFYNSRSSQWIFMMNYHIKWQLQCKKNSILFLCRFLCLSLSLYNVFQSQTFSSSVFLLKLFRASGEMKDSHLRGIASGPAFNSNLYSHVSPMGLNCNCWKCERESLRNREKETLKE